jgi:hypothetical protein
MSRKHKHAFDAKRIDATSWDPNDLTLLTDPKDKLYDKHVEDEVPDEDVLNVAAVGVLQPIVIRKREHSDGRVEAVVIAGRQRTKRSLVVNALVGQPYRGSVKAVHAAIKRMTTVLASIEIAKRVIAICPEGVRVPAVHRNRGDDASAREIKSVENAFRRREDPIVYLADDAQRLSELGRAPEEIAEAMKCSVATVRRYLKMDTSKPRKPPQRRGKATRPSVKQLVSLREKINGGLTEREKALFDWWQGDGSSTTVERAFGVEP